jgi:hypothetical protein
LDSLNGRNYQNVNSDTKKDPENDSLMISERDNGVHSNNNDRIYNDNEGSVLSLESSLYENGVSNIYIDQTTEIGEERTNSSTYNDGSNRGNYQHLNSYQYSPSAPPLSLAQQRELTSLGLL